MLVLTRKLNEEIVIGDNIRITIVELASGRVKIGVTAPRNVTVDRAEIREQKMAEEAKTPQLMPIPEIVAARAELLPVAEPAVLSTTPGPVEHKLPANRLSALRQRFPRKPK